MTGQEQYLTVFRSAELEAEQEANTVCALLREGGFHPELFDEKTPGVVLGTIEVRVPAAEAPEAEALVNRDHIEEVDPSPELDLVTLMATDGTTGEMEATAVQNILEANGISAFIVGNSTLPNFGFEVRVPREDLPRAEAVIAEARAAGPAAALEAEQQTEGIGSGPHG
jgi:hypothetical protein